MPADAGKSHYRTACLGSSRGVVWTPLGGGLQRLRPLAVPASAIARLAITWLFFTACSRGRPLCRVAGGSGAVAVFPLLVKAVSLANEYIIVKDD